MLDLKNINHMPTIDEINSYIHNPLFPKFYQFIITEYKALTKIEFSKDVWAPGWNIKLRKAGKGLCVIYPQRGYFTVLVVVGAKEKESVEQLLPHLSTRLQEIYHNTKEGNSQRWLMIDLESSNSLYEDVLKLIHIRRTSK